MKTRLQVLAKILVMGFKNPLRNQPDYGAGESILDKLAEKAGTDLETLYKNHEPFPRQAMEFDTEEEMQEYLKDHPNADRTNHHVRHKFNEELTGYSGGQKDLTLSLHRDKVPVGKIDYSEYAGKPKVKFIHVNPEERRKGYGTLLLKKLQQNYPDQEIDLGMLTEEGSKLVDSLHFQEHPTQHADSFKRLEGLKVQLSALEKKIDEDSEKGILIKEDWEKRDDLDREVYTLESELSSESPTKRILS